MNLQHAPKVSFKQDYPVPDDYFAQLPHRVLARLEDSPSAKGPLHDQAIFGRRQWIAWTTFNGHRLSSKAWAVAASMVLVLGTWIFWKVSSPEDSPLLSSEAFSNHLAGLSAEEIHDEVLLGNYRGLVEEHVENNSESQAILTSFVQDLRHESMSLQEAWSVIPDEVGDLVEDADLDI